MSDLHVGVVGTGGLGTGLGHQFNDADGAALVAIADVSDENRERAGEELGVPEEARYGDHEAMIDAEDLDGVAIATPHTLHYGQVVDCMEAGLNVLCEKPLCTDLDHARDLVDRAESGDQTLMVGYQRHLGPAYIEARDQLRSHEGHPKFITAEITQPWIDNQRGAWRTNPELSGGGQLYDTGSHVVDATLWMTELTPTAVSAEMVFDDDLDGVDTQAVLNVTFEEDAAASISISGDAPRVREHIHIWDDDGAVYVYGHEWDDREITVIDTENNESVPDIGHEQVSKCQAFVDSVREGTEPPATARDAFYVTAVTEAAYESATTGERVDISLEE
jgi:predicted dehydrogenase